MSQAPNLSKPRIIVYIDGANFHHGLRDFNQKYSDFHVDFNRFCKKYCGNRDLVDIHYYSIHYSKGKNIIMHNKQKFFFDSLKAVGINVDLLEINSGSNKIKGDDIKLALDMFEDAFKKNFDIGVLVSGDGDFEPLIRKVHKYHKKVELWYFEGRTSRKLMMASDSKEIITRSQIRKFYSKFKKKLAIV